MNESEIKRIEINLTTGDKLSFNGKYRRDLEKPNWHYYEGIFGELYHFRKEMMVYVVDYPISCLEAGDASKKM